MRIVNVHKAKTELSRLLEAVEQGEDVVIARAGVPVARLVPVRLHQRVPGRLSGTIRIREDFDAPLPAHLAHRFGSDVDASPFPAPPSNFGETSE